MHPIETAPVTLVDLLRHGMPEGGPRYRGSLDDPLSEQGWREMWSAVGEGGHWDAVLSSPLRRCADFARAVAEREQLPLAIEPRFREIGFGEWEGRHVTAILEESPEQVQRYWGDPVTNTPPGGEPLVEFQHRLVAAWEALLADYRGQRVLLVAHGGVMRMLLTYAMAMPIAAVLRWEVPNATISRLRVQPDVNGEPFTSLVFHAGTLA